MIVKIKARPNSERLSFELKDGVIRAGLTEPAENNRANLQLVKELTKIFGGCRFVAGKSSKSKAVELPVTPEELKQRLHTTNL